MSDDPYETLGVARDASAAAISKAYRTLAKKYHPDLHPDDAAAVARFHGLTAAKELLSDPEQRGRFDRGEIDGQGKERAVHPGARGAQQMDPGDLEEMLGALFRRGAETGSRRGWDEHYTIEVAFLDAVNGATRRLALPDGRVLDVKIPAGTADEQVLRLRGKGGPGQHGAAAGDALIEIRVLAHRHFSREGADIRLTLPVTLAEAVLGGFVEMPTPRGPLRVRVPARSDTGTELRLRGRGVPAHGGRAAGDLLASLRVVLSADPALEEFLRGRGTEGAVDPRAGMV
jgi:DnaJ-class molecular chaperone